MLFVMTYRNDTNGTRKDLEIYARNSDEAEYKARAVLGNGWTLVNLNYKR